MTTFPLFPVFILQDTPAARAEREGLKEQNEAARHIGMRVRLCTSRFWQMRRRKQVQQAWRPGYDSEITVGSRPPVALPVEEAAAKDLPQHIVQAPAKNGASDAWIGRRCAGVVQGTGHRRLQHLRMPLLETWMRPDGSLRNQATSAVG